MGRNWKIAHQLWPQHSAVIAASVLLLLLSGFGAVGQEVGDTAGVGMGELCPFLAVNQQEF